MTEIADIFQGLKANAPSLKQTDAKTRSDKILALLDATLARKEELYAAAHKERGTCDMDSAAELMMLSMEAKFIAKNVAKWTKPQRVKGSLASMGKKSYVYYEPKGVVLNLSTWNAPAVIGLYPLLPAIAAGNACLLKPSELAPYSAEVLEKIVADVFPADEFAVTSGGPDVAQALLAQPFDHIYYTGGHKVGRIVMEAAAKNFASITLEMGGKSPVIIDPSVNAKNAAKKIIWGRMANAGQMCVAADYVLCPEGKQDELVTALIAAANELYNADGQGFDKAPEFARIINDAHFGRIKHLLDDAIAKGAKVALGGDTDASARYIAPTILTGATEDMDIMQEEVFGPILPIMTYKTREEAVEITERRTKPLALYIYGTDDASMEWFITHTTAGSTVINHNCVQSGTNPNLPFGGVGHSGMGRVGGFRGFVEMSNARAVMKQPLDRLRDMAVNFPPYSDRYKGMVAKGLGD